MFSTDIAQARMTDMRREADAYRLARKARSTHRREQPSDPRSRWVKAA